MIYPGGPTIILEIVQALKQAESNMHIAHYSHAIRFASSEIREQLLHIHLRNHRALS